MDADNRHMGVNQTTEEEYKLENRSQLIPPNKWLTNMG